MSENNYEQRHATTFCVKLGESASVPFKRLKMLMVNIPYTELKFFDSINPSWKAEKTLKTNSVQGGIRLENPTKH